MVYGLQCAVIFVVISLTTRLAEFSRHRINSIKCPTIPIPEFGIARFSKQKMELELINLELELEL